MLHIKERAVAPLGAVLCVCACLVGCERKDSTPSKPPAEPAAKSQEPAATSVVSRAEVRSTTASIDERGRDAAYQERLTDEFGKDRQRIGKRLAQIEARMAQLREYAKMPPDATDEQVEAALEGTPQQEWRERVQARQDCIAEEQRSKAAAQAAVAQRILRQEQTGDRAQGAASAEK